MRTIEKQCKTFLSFYHDPSLRDGKTLSTFSVEEKLKMAWRMTRHTPFCHFASNSRFIQIYIYWNPSQFFTMFLVLCQLSKNCSLCFLGLNKIKKNIRKKILNKYLKNNFVLYMKWSIIVAHWSHHSSDNCSNINIHFYIAGKVYAPVDHSQNNENTWPFLIPITNVSTIKLGRKGQPPTSPISTCTAYRYRIISTTYIRAHSDDCHSISNGSRCIDQVY